MELIERVRGLSAADRSVIQAMLSNPDAAHLTETDSPLHVLWQQLAYRGWTEPAPEGARLSAGRVLYRLTDMGRADLPRLVADAEGRH